MHHSGKNLNKTQNRVFVASAYLVWLNVLFRVSNEITETTNKVYQG